MTDQDQAYDHATRVATQIANTPNLQGNKDDILEFAGRQIKQFGPKFANVLRDNPKLGLTEEDITNLIASDTNEKK